MKNVVVQSTKYKVCSTFFTVTLPLTIQSFSLRASASCADLKKLRRAGLFF